MSAASPAKPRGRLGMVLISKSQYHFIILCIFMNFSFLRSVDLLVQPKGGLLVRG